MVGAYDFGGDLTGFLLLPEITRTIIRRTISTAKIPTPIKTTGTFCSMLIITRLSSPGTKVHISASHEGYSANGVTYTVVPGDDNLVIISMEQNVPVVLIGVGIFAVLIVLLIIVLVISGRRRKPVKSPPRSYAPTNKRDSF